MNAIVSIFERELKGYFSTPVAYVFIVTFLVLLNWITFDMYPFFLANNASLGPMFYHLPYLLVILVPGISMRLWAEERKSGTVELLFTMPITSAQAILGKFFAAWTFLIIVIALTFPAVITVNYLGDPDGGAIFGGYLAAILTSGMLLSIGCFTSALTRNQITSFILSIIIGAVLLFAGAFELTAALNFSEVLTELTRQFGIMGHYEQMIIGVVSLNSLVYFLAMTCAWLTACGILLELKKAE